MRDNKRMILFMKKNIVKIANEFLSIASNFDSIGLYEPFELDAILAIVPDRINEVEIDGLKWLCTIFNPPLIPM